jgi:hypothetical protein
MLNKKKDKTNRSKDAAKGFYNTVDYKSIDDNSVMDWNTIYTQILMHEWICGDIIWWPVTSYNIAHTSSRRDLIDGAFVDLIDGAFVDLIDGAFVDLIDGAFVDLIDGAFVDLIDDAFVDLDFKNRKSTCVRKVE